MVIFTPDHGRALLGLLHAPDAHAVGVNPQRPRDAGAEEVRLDQHGRQRAQVLDAGAIGQPAEGVRALDAGLDLEEGQVQLGAEELARRADLLDTRDIAASRPRPASTQVTSRSMASGRARSIGSAAP